MAALRIDRPDRLLLRAERVEERDERAALQMRHHIEIGKLADAVTFHVRHTELVSRSMARPDLQRRAFLFHTKTQSHEEEGSGRVAHFPIDDSTDCMVAKGGRFAAGATSLCLCVFV